LIDKSALVRLAASQDFDLIADITDQPVERLRIS